jgi:hypothetical protein
MQIASATDAQLSRERILLQATYSVRLTGSLTKQPVLDTYVIKPLRVKLYILLFLSFCHCIAS